MHKNILIAGAGVAALLALCGALVAPVAGEDASAPSPASTSASAPASAAAPDQDVLAAGKHIWNDAACYNCHGATAGGGHSADFPAGPSLRTSGLDPQTMLQMVECGIPDSRMPAWLKGAYTQVACYGNALGPAPSGTIAEDAYSDADLKNLVAYVQTNFMRQPMPKW